MQFLWLFLVILTTANAGHRHVLDPRDPVPSDNNAVLWDTLYSKLNALMGEANALKEIILDMKHRQTIQGDQIEQLLENCHSDTQQQQQPQYQQQQHQQSQQQHQQSQQQHQQHEQQRRHQQQQQHPSVGKPMDIKAPTQNHQWIPFLRRQDGSVDFQRNWTDYKYGFGNPDGEFFMGLEKIHAMTSRTPHELLIILEDWDNERRYAKYDRFHIGGENEEYAITELGSYSGDAGDSLTYHNGMKFSTLDRSNSGLCPQNYGGGWWFNECEDSNLNSVYRQRYDIEDMRKIIWNTWKGWNYSLRFAEMKIRPKD